MSTRFRFEGDERERVERAHAAAVSAAEAAGVRIARIGPLHAGYHRWLVGRIRSATGLRPRHGDVAARLLEWSRALGRIELFALCPVAHAIDEAEGGDGVARASRFMPSLADAHALMDGPASRDRDVPFSQSLEGARTAA